MALEGPLWRAIAVYRFASLAYAFVLVLQNYNDYRHPLGGWLVLVAMALWTGYAVYAFADPSRRGWPLLVADLAITACCLLATIWVEAPERRIAEQVPTLTITWVAGPVLSWAVSGGKRRGAIAALLLGIADFTVRGSLGFGGFQPSQAVSNGPVLLFLAGIGVGHVAKLATDAEARFARAVELEAATRERERLARHIHDSVLQVLALVRRRGQEAGGEAAEIGRLAGEQEAALRALIGSAEPPASTVLGAGAGPGIGPGVADLRAPLASLASDTVTVSAPATPVRLAGDVAAEVAHAVGAAIDNVGKHCGERTRAWVLLEEDGDMVTVTVRDEGPGIPAGRLEEAAHDGRLGVSHSIRGRVRDLGGRVSITSNPGEGTEVELSVPRWRDPT